MILPARFVGTAPYGDVRLVSTSVQVGTGATSVANTATTSVILPKPACTQCQLLLLQMDALVAAVSASGTVLATAYKRDNSGTPADRTLTGSLSMEANVVTVAQTTYAFPITSTSIVNLTFRASDLARIDIVTDNSVGTQPTATFVAMWAIIKP